MNIFTYFQNISASKKCDSCGTQWKEIKKCKFCDLLLCKKCFNNHKTIHQCSGCEDFFQDLLHCTKCSLQFCDDCWPDHSHVEKCTICEIVSSDLLLCNACQKYYCSKCMHDHPEEPIKINPYRVLHTKHGGSQILMDKNVLTDEERKQRELEDGLRR